MHLDQQAYQAGLNSTHFDADTGEPPTSVAAKEQEQSQEISPGHIQDYSFLFRFLKISVTTVHLSKAMVHQYNLLDR